MTLRITRQSDPITVETLTVCIYAPPGVGKTSIAFTAERPLCLDFDGGAYRSAFRKDSVQVSKWGDVAEMTREDLEPYSTVVVDTVGRALDALTVEIIEKDPKLGRAGNLTLQGWGQLKAMFVAWTKLVRSFGKDVVMLSHATEEKRGDDLVERLDVQGGSKTEIYKCADAMGRLSVDKAGKWLNFSPTETAYGKNPAGFEPLKVPDFAHEPDFLARIIAETKDHLNATSQAALEEQARLEEWRESFEQLDSLEDVNAKVDELKKANAEPVVKGLLMQAARGKGFEWDKGAGRFVEAVAV